MAQLTKLDFDNLILLVLKLRCLINRTAICLMRNEQKLKLTVWIDNFLPRLRGRHSGDGMVNVGGFHLEKFPPRFKSATFYNELTVA